MRVLKGQPRGLDGANENAQRASRWSAAKATCGNLAGAWPNESTPEQRGEQRGLTNTRPCALLLVDKSAPYRFAVHPGSSRKKMETVSLIPYRI